MGRRVVAPARRGGLHASRRRSSVLDFAAKYRRDLLYNRYQAGRDVIAQVQRTVRRTPISCRRSRTIR